MRRCKVAIVEPSPIIAEGLASLIAQCGEFDVVGVMENLRQFAERAAGRQAELVVVGSQVLCGMGQPLRTTMLELQSVAVVLLATTVCNDDVLRQVDGVVNIYDDQQQLLRKLRAAIEQGQTNPYSDSHDLSERECDVLVLVAKGLANKEIADRLNISIHTVMSHRKNITHKTGIKSVAGLTVYALLNNLLDQNDVTL